MFLKHIRKHPPNKSKRRKGHFYDECGSEEDETYISELDPSKASEPNMQTLIDLPDELKPGHKLRLTLLGKKRTGWIAEDELNPTSKKTDHVKEQHESEHYAAVVDVIRRVAKQLNFDRMAVSNAVKIVETHLPAADARLGEFVKLGSLICKVFTDEIGIDLRHQRTDDTAECPGAELLARALLTRSRMFTPQNRMTKLAKQSHWEPFAMAFVRVFEMLTFKMR